MLWFPQLIAESAPAADASGREFFPFFPVLSGKDQARPRLTCSRFLRALVVPITIVGLFELYEPYLKVCRLDGSQIRVN